jgi:hypothetical protein
MIYNFDDHVHKPKYVSNNWNRISSQKAQTNELPQVPWHAYTEPDLQAIMTSHTQHHIFHTVTFAVNHL